VSASSISPRGNRSCILETRNSEGKICDILHWVENSRRSEYISTVDLRRHTVVDLIVQRLGTLGVFKSLRVKSVEAQSRKGTQTIDLVSLWDLSQLLDQEVEGQGKYFKKLSLQRS
jgi:hypothetical protein